MKSLVILLFVALGLSMGALAFGAGGVGLLCTGFALTVAGVAVALALSLGSAIET